jgi:hypothetical protein
MCNVYKEKVPTVEGYQFDGANGEEIIEWLGGPDYGVVSGDKLILSLQGKDPRSTKVTVSRGQFVVTSKAGTSVVNEGEFVGAFSNEDGSDIVSLPPPEPPPPEADEDLVYQPGFGPLTEEDKKRAEKKAADDKKKAAADKKEEKKEEHLHPVHH